MPNQNFILGKGEKLTASVVIKGGGGEKVPPYTFAEAKARLTPMINATAKSLEAIPSEACPNGQVIGSITLNPEYIAKSYYPADLLNVLGLEAVGSRAIKIKPEKKSKNREPIEAVTTELFVAGTKAAFADWENKLEGWSSQSKVAASFVAIESVQAPIADAKVKGTLAKNKNTIFEVVLHTPGRVESPVKEFNNYLKAIGVEQKIEKTFYAGGLCFAQLEAPSDKANQIAAFSIVRALREMPKLRLLEPAIRASIGPKQSIILPDADPLDKDLRAAIFDGGLPDKHPISRWASYHQDNSLLAAHPDYLTHGVGVTSAFLFGHLDPKLPVPTPYCNVKHYRVIDDAPGQDPTELYEVLSRIKDILSNDNFDLINLSLGPMLPVEDDDVHAWTSVLDELLSSKDTLATVAVGNTGESDVATGLHRIQVPSDCVNALAIGACDTPDAVWQKAPYSSVGPGRSPGLIKPDLVDFGGSITRPFLVLGPDLSPVLSPTGGTSFSSPSVLRLGAGVRAHFGKSMSMLSIKALMIHTASRGDQPIPEVGRGRIASNLEEMVVTGDDCIRVIYQGELTAGKHMRAHIPLPLDTLSGKVSITATLCYSTEVDAHHPGNYTRAGVDAVFRPNENARKKAEQMHPDTKEFFGKGRKGMTEEELRRDAWKWENCLHASVNFFGTSLQNPFFDIHYNSRMEGYNHTPRDKLRYAMVITVRAPNEPELYNKVLRRYATTLEQMKPVIDIPVRV